MIHNFSFPKRQHEIGDSVSVLLTWEDERILLDCVVFGYQYQSQEILDSKMVGNQINLRATGWIYTLWYIEDNTHCFDIFEESDLIPKTSKINHSLTFS